jgi:hypothetical protein
MFKKNKKGIDKKQSFVVSSDAAFLESAKALKAAYKIAKHNRDLEAILLISDRWSAMGRMLESEDDIRIPMGFTGNNDRNDSEHNG